MLQSNRRLFWFYTKTRLQTHWDVNSGEKKKIRKKNGEKGSSSGRKPFPPPTAPRCHSGGGCNVQALIFFAFELPKSRVTRSAAACRDGSQDLSQICWQFVQVPDNIITREGLYGNLIQGGATRASSHGWYGSACAQCDKLGPFAHAAGKPNLPNLGKQQISEGEKKGDNGSDG